MAALCVGRIPSEIEPEWMAVVVLGGSGTDAEVMQASRAQQVNWWGFGLELFLSVSEERQRKVTTG